MNGIKVSVKVHSHTPLFGEWSQQLLNKGIHTHTHTHTHTHSTLILTAWFCCHVYWLARLPASDRGHGRHTEEVLGTRVETGDVVTHCGGGDGRRDVWLEGETVLDEVGVDGGHGVETGSPAKVDPGGTNGGCHTHVGWGEGRGWRREGGREGGRENDKLSCNVHGMPIYIHYNYVHVSCIFSVCK